MAYYRADYHHSILVATLLQAAIEGKITLMSDSKSENQHYKLKLHSEKDSQSSDEEQLIWDVLFKTSNTFSTNKSAQLQEASLKLEHFLEDQIITDGLASNFGMLFKLITWSISAVALFIAGWIFLNFLYISLGLLSVSAVFFIISFFAPRLTSLGRNVKREIQNAIKSHPGTFLSPQEWLQLIPTIWIGNKINEWHQFSPPEAFFPDSHFVVGNKTLDSAESICTFVQNFTESCLRNLNQTHGAMQGVENQYDVSIGI